jgi:hypothetical protein
VVDDGDAAGVDAQGVDRLCHDDGRDRVVVERRPERLAEADPSRALRSASSSARARASWSCSARAVSAEAYDVMSSETPTTPTTAPSSSRTGPLLTQTSIGEPSCAPCELARPDAAGEQGRPDLSARSGTRPMSSRTGRADGLSTVQPSSSCAPGLRPTIRPARSTSMTGPGSCSTRRPVPSTGRTRRSLRRQVDHGRSVTASGSPSAPANG